MKGITTHDLVHYNPRCNRGGTIKKGTAVHLQKKDDWQGWVVTNKQDAAFMGDDWAYSFVDVPEHAITILKDDAPS